MKVFSFILGSISCPSSRYRVYNYIKELNEGGICIKYSHFWGELYFKHVLGSRSKLLKVFMLFLYYPFCIMRRYISIFRIIGFEVVHIERDFCPGFPVIGEWIIKKIFKKKLVYEYDDAVFLSDVPRGKTKKVIKMSDGVIAGNRYLGDYAKSYCKNTVCIPTSIDTTRYSIEKALAKAENSKVVIGWIGSFSTLKYMELIKESLSRIAAENDIELCIVCNKNLEWNTNIKIKNIPWGLETYLKAICRFDIGIMPLESTDWEKGKCGFKLIQYMGVGIPVVASAVGVNNDLISDSKNGFLAESNEQWYHCLSKLINDVDLRNSMGEKGLALVKERYSVQANSAILIDFYKNIVE